MDMDDPEEIIRARFRALGLSTEESIRGAKEVLHALSARGLAVVPVEPTEAMIQAGYDMQCSDWPSRWSDDGCTPELYTARNIWPSMLAAARPSLKEGT